MHRVVVHPRENGLRILVEFTGMAGAYRAVRALDGCVTTCLRRHLFHGRPIESHYYSVDAFRAGIYE